MYLRRSHFDIVYPSIIQWYYEGSDILGSTLTKISLLLILVEDDFFPTLFACANLVLLPEQTHGCVDINQVSVSLAHPYLCETL